MSPKAATSLSPDLIIILIFARIQTFPKANLHHTLMINKADSQSLEGVIIIFMSSVRAFFHPPFQNQTKKNLHYLSDCGLSEWIIEDFCLVFLRFPSFWNND